MLQTSMEATLDVDKLTASASSQVSGLFESQPIDLPVPMGREEFRLDVDGPFPLMKASGTLFGNLTQRVHWVANLVKIANGSYNGLLFFKEGSSVFPFTHLTIQVQGSSLQRNLRVQYSGGGSQTLERTFSHRSNSLRTVEFEYDVVSDTDAVTAFQTHDHPNRPANLPSETLTIETVFARAGFAVSKSSGDGQIPLEEAGLDNVWSDNEMHDAMQSFWLRFANRPQWSMWTLFAGRHITGPSLGGIMFDSIGPNHRQGTAIFGSSFIAQAPENDPAPEAWVRRMRFWTAVHEMGHSFNLAHAWQKSLENRSWIPMRDEPESRSFMNYPFRVAGNEAAFFRDFQFRFSDAELLFLRHAPEKFVQMGNAAWFDHHGFEQANLNPSSPFSLQLRVNRPRADFEFLEPVLVEAKLSNRTSEPQIIPEQLLAMRDLMTIVIKKQGQDSRQYLPVVRYCWKSRNRVLQPGESVYESLFLAAGQPGWYLCEPGKYNLQVLLRLPDGSDVLSNQLGIRICPPFDRQEEILAQDYFSPEVGRVLRFDGSRILTGANDVLRELTERFPERRAAIHARVALANPLTRRYKELVADGSGNKKLVEHNASPESAQQFLEPLLSNAQQAAESLGHIEYKRSVDRLTDGLLAAERWDMAAKNQALMYQTLSARAVAPQVLEKINLKQQSCLRDR